MKISGQELGLWSIMKSKIGFCSAEFQEIATHSEAFWNPLATETITEAIKSFIKRVQVIGESSPRQIGEDDQATLLKIYQALMGSETISTPQDMESFSRGGFV